ncbi:protein of unknown function [Hyphomicrobium sp. MC1]|nr:protein of unknown function [Hyphomicrobium sp. MC1]
MGAIDGIDEACGVSVLAGSATRGSGVATRLNIGLPPNKKELLSPFPLRHSITLVRVHYVQVGTGARIVSPRRRIRRAGAAIVKTLDQKRNGPSRLARPALDFP